MATSPLSLSLVLPLNEPSSWMISCFCTLHQVESLPRFSHLQAVSSFTASSSLQLLIFIVDPSLHAAILTPDLAVVARARPQVKWWYTRTCACLFNKLSFTLHNTSITHSHHTRQIARKRQKCSSRVDSPQSSSCTRWFSSSYSLLFATSGLASPCCGATLHPMQSIIPGFSEILRASPAGHSLQKLLPSRGQPALTVTQQDTAWRDFRTA